MLEFIVNNEYVVSGVIGIISSIVTFFLTKRRYRAEVSTTEIQNLKESLNFYKDVLNENQKLLREYMDKVDESLVEIHNLRKAVSDLLSMSCIDKSCINRQLIDRKMAKNYLSIEENSNNL